MEKLKIVILESPYDNWSNPLVGNFLKDLMGLKLRGYSHEYPYGVLPVDGADLFSTHLALCREEKNGQLTPIMAMRWTSLKKSRQHHMNFPGMSLLFQAGATEHMTALEKIIAEVDEKNLDLMYTACLTIEPKERSSKERSAFLRELLTTMFVCQQQELGVELLAGGTCRFKIEKWLTASGWNSLKAEDDRALESINVKHLAGELVHVMHLQEYSFEAQRIARKWQYLWDERLIIDGTAPAEIRPFEKTA